MGRVRRLLIGSAGALAGYASGKVLLRGGNDRGVGLVLPGEDELLGSVRGRPEIVRGDRKSVV